MSKKYDRENRIFDRLQEENKKLKQENKRLKKQVSSLSKGYYKFLYTDTEEDTQEAVKQAKEVAKKICFDCRMGELKLSILGNKYWRYCNNCTKRTKTKDISNLTREELKKYNEA